jgi:hypothetical protein
MSSKLKFTCASISEKAQTLTTSQFEGFSFNDGEVYKVVFENGKSATARVTRNGRTLYISASEFPSGLKRAEVGSPVLRKIKSIKKVK